METSARNIDERAGLGLIFDLGLGLQLNGDFTISHWSLLAGDLDRVQSLQPTRR
jgi:hypothetical protein